MIRFYDFRAVRCFSVLHNETPTEVVCLMAVGGFINSAFKIRLEILAFLYFLGIQNASLIVCPVCPVQCRFIVSQLVSLPSVMFPNSE